MKDIGVFGDRAYVVGRDQVRKDSFGDLPVLQHIAYAAGRTQVILQDIKCPVLVADQLPDTHYAKKLSLAFRAAHLKANGVASTDSFAPYAFDAWLIFADAAARAKAKARGSLGKKKKTVKC